MGQHKSALQVVVPLQGTEDIRAADTVGVAHGYIVYALRAKESVAFKLHSTIHASTRRLMFAKFL